LTPGETIRRREIAVRARRLIRRAHSSPERHPESNQAADKDRNQRQRLQIHQMSKEPAEAVISMEKCKVVFREIGRRPGRDTDAL